MHAALLFAKSYIDHSNTLTAFSKRLYSARTKRKNVAQVKVGICCCTYGAIAHKLLKPSRCILKISLLSLHKTN